MLWATSKMILGLGVVIVVLFLLVKLLRRTNVVRGDFLADTSVRLITTKPIAPQKYVSLVDIAGDIFALGISEAQITLLTKIENKTFLEKLAARGSNHPETLSFFQRIKSGSLRTSHEK